MPAVLATLACFIAWWVIGLGLLTTVRADTGNLRLALAAPALGSAAMVLPLFVLSNLGLPMRTAGPFTVYALLIGALVVVALRPPRLPIGVVPVALVCLASLGLIARPMFLFGFDWIANANSDMAFYVLSATSLLHHGLLSPVDFAGLAQNRDFASAAQTAHSSGIRVGSDITLAALSASARRSPIEFYMPMIVAINLCAICGAGSLAMQFARKWWAATLAAILLAVSPLAAYGVLQQLLPQTWGLALAVALAALVMRQEMHSKPGPRINEIALVCVLAGALFVVYPEVATTLAVSYALFVALLVLRRRVSPSAVLRLWIPPVVATALVANTFLSRELRFLRVGVHGGVHGGAGLRELFGYAVVPKALPAIVGLQSLFASTSAPRMDSSIVAAVALLIIALLAATVGALKGSAASVVVLSDFALGALLASRGSDFGLFKLYMYSQPFLAAAAASWLFGLSRRPAVVGCAVVLATLIAVQVHTQQLYAANARNPIDLRNASEADLLPAFRSTLNESSQPVVTVTDNFTLATLEGASAGRSRRLYFVSRNVFNLPWRTRHFQMPANSNISRVPFDESVGTSKVLSSGRCEIVMPSGSQLALNRRVFPEGSPDLEMVDCDTAKDLLVFVVSSVGQPFSIPEHRHAVSFWQLEPDPVFPGKTFSGFGRYALLRILGPSRTVRLELDFSTSSTQSPTGSYRLPPASAIGTERVRFPVVGGGAARVLSPPFHPQIIGGQAYVLLDMGVPGRFPIVRRPGLTGLWGESIPLDPRRLTSYVRDVSIVSARDDDSKPPLEVRNFPPDLARSGLQYSGIFEDGWIGTRSYFVIAGGPRAVLTLRANVLRSPIGQHLRILVDGRTVYSDSVVAGPAVVTVPIPASGTARRIDLHWARAVRLGPQDRRPASAQLVYLGTAAGTR